jgi:hypothetical protein
MTIVLAGVGLAWLTLLGMGVPQPSGMASPGPESRAMGAADAAGAGEVGEATALDATGATGTESTGTEAIDPATGTDLAADAFDPAAPQAPQAPGEQGVPNASGAPAAPKPTLYRGWAFDTCHAPSTTTLSRWRASRYRAVGVYFGGRGRACRSQPLLTRAWMRTTHRLGWSVLPIYVGSQSPCVYGQSKRSVRIGRNPARQGVAEGRDAVRRAKALGMLRGSALYLDMEAYAYKQKSCARTTLSFVRAWDRTLRKYGYLPGFYSSAETGVRHIEVARRAGVKDLPGAMWFARWRVSPGLYAERVLRWNAWPARRIHQYAGNVRERHGGRTLTIDRNLLNAPVAKLR